MTDEKKNKGGRPRKEADPLAAEFRFNASVADIEFVDAAAKRLGITRGALIRKAVEAYVDPLARLQQAANATDQMRADMREMRGLFGKIHDLIKRVADFITDLYAAENAADMETAAESAKRDLAVMDDDIEHPDEAPSPSIPKAVEGDDAMGWER
ncbi:DUF2397 family protein [Rhizobium sp. RU36D]|uniref:DUF2397 family protein n=1 Tax=Rhizobium sp. RU36D TaxID=1907415 RepID=UPI0009D83A23|nr:DUF2397 family protein [Rhizobium sp. RU36D]SMD16418.1 Protein of unknown function [Rhizobium sp. RU36D]